MYGYMKKGNQTPMAQGRSNNIIFYSDQEVVDEKLSFSGGPEEEGVRAGVGRVRVFDQRRVVHLEGYPAHKKPPPP